MTDQILGLLFNTLAADDKHPVPKRDTLTIPIQMELSQKRKTFSQFFAPFLKFRLNFKCFQEKDDAYRFCTTDIRDSENVVR